MIVTKQTYANAIITDDVDALQEIHLSDKNIAIFERDMAILGSELDQIVEHPIECMLTGTSEEILVNLKERFDNSSVQFPLLFEDISKLLLLFEIQTKASSFRLMLAPVSTDMCTRFHTDINDLRLLCTYIGQGTLWLPDEAIDQKALQSGGAKQEFVVEERHIQQANTGDIVLLKGALYPEANPILHRSPAIEATGETRFILRIDTNQFLNF